MFSTTSKGSLALGWLLPLKGKKDGWKNMVLRQKIEDSTENWREGLVYSQENSRRVFRSVVV